MFYRVEFLYCPISRDIAGEFLMKRTYRFTKKRAKAVLDQWFAALSDEDLMNYRGRTTRWSWR